MTCKYTPNDVGRYLFNKMTPEEEAEFQFHLGQCEKCRTDLQAIRDLAEGLKDEENPQEEPALPVKERNKFLRYYAVAASILILCGLGIVFYYSRSEHSDTKKALSPEIYLHQDSVRHTNDTLTPLQ